MDQNGVNDRAIYGFNSGSRAPGTTIKKNINIT